MKSNALAHIWRTGRPMRRAVLGWSWLLAAGAVLSMGQPALAHEGHEAHDAGMASMDHHHGDPVVVPAGQRPTVRLTLHPEPDHGWYVSLETTNFTFAPAHAGGKAVTGEGHGHLYLDGEEIDRLYGPDEFMKPLSPGQHVVEVVLNSNDHRPYKGDDGRLAADSYKVVIPEGDAPFPPVTQAHAYQLKAGALVGAEETLRVKKGDVVALRWSTDTPLELHMHGYDVETELTPEMDTTMLFVANMVGRFPIERHGATESTVLYLEVLP
jgi:hypothetical protein